METTKTSNETLNESEKLIEKLFSNTNTAMIDMYKKQVDMTTSFYSNLFNSTFGNSTGLNQNSGFPNMFSNPFNNFSQNNFQNPFLATIDKTIKQIMEFNQNLFSVLTNGFEKRRIDFGAISEEYKETINVGVEATKEIHNIISKAFNEKLESSMEIDKKATEEISNQLNLVTKQNQKLWTDFFKTYQTPLKNEEKISKEPILSENKKSSNTAVKEFKDHKSQQEVRK
jgi:hypothetical protein